MESLIGLMIIVLIYAIVIYGAYWICTHFGLPRPVFWIVGAILLIALLLYVLNTTGGAPHLRLNGK